MKHRFIYYLCIGTFGSLSIINATSIFNYLVINNTSATVNIPSHNITLKSDDSIMLKNRRAPLKELEVLTEDDPVKFTFKQALKDNSAIELYKENGVIFAHPYAPDQPLELDSP